MCCRFEYAARDYAAPERRLCKTAVNVCVNPHYVQWKLSTINVLDSLQKTALKHNALKQL